MKTYLMILFLIFTGICVYSYTNDNIEYSQGSYYNDHIDYSSKPELMTDGNIRLITILGIIVLIIVILLIVNFIDKRNALKHYYTLLGELMKIEKFDIQYTDIDDMDTIMEKMSAIIMKKNTSVKYYHDTIKFGINDPMFVMFFDLGKLEGNWAQGYNGLIEYITEIKKLKTKWNNLNDGLNKLINTIREHDSYVLKEEYNLIWETYTYIQRKHSITMGYERYLGINKERINLLDGLIMEIGELYMNDLHLAFIKLKSYESELKLFRKSYEVILQTKDKYDKKM